jgi:hypothetical protein
MRGLDFCVMHVYLSVCMCSFICIQYRIITIQIRIISFVGCLCIRVIEYRKMHNMIFL